MSCDVSTSLLCKNTFWPLEILSSTPTFPIWSSRHFCTTTRLNISLKILPSVWRCQQIHIIQFYAKTHWCSLKNLSKSSSFALWSSWVFSTATLFCIARVPLRSFLLIVHPAKPLRPGEWTHWNTFGPCNNSLYFLSRFGFLKNLHKGVFLSN